MKEDIESIEKVVDELRDLLEYGYPYSDFYNIEYSLDKIKKCIKDQKEEIEEKTKLLKSSYERIKELEEENIEIRNQVKDILYDEI